MPPALTLSVNQPAKSPNADHLSPALTAIIFRHRLATSSNTGRVAHTAALTIRKDEPMLSWPFIPGHSLLAFLLARPLSTMTVLVPLVATVFGLLTLRVSAASPSKLNLVPFPTKASIGNTVVCLGKDFAVQLDATSLHGKTAPGDLLAAIERANAHVKNGRHEYLSVSGGLEFFDGAQGCDNYIDALILSFEPGADYDSILSHATAPVEKRKDAEGYKLSVPTAGRAHVVAGTALGLFRGLTTFENLVYHADGSAVASGSTQTASGQVPLGSSVTETQEDVAYAPFAPYELEDKPAFPWRAVLLDTSRHFFSKSSILKMLDTMALVKVSPEELSC